MFERRIDLFSLFGFRIGIDPSWFIVAVLITWSLARGLFPWLYEGLPAATYWAMGVSGAIGLFSSVVLHELAHALVARRYNIRMRGITLFVFGGVVEMEGEPPGPQAELMVAIAGPLASLGIALVCFVVNMLGQAAALPIAVTGVLSYLALINSALVIFNLIPAFPLDGGRVLRSALWRWKGNLRWATRITSRMGLIFGNLLITLGVMNLLLGNIVSGIWWVLLGFFMRGTANASYQELLMRQALEGVPVHRLMHTQPITVPPSITIEALVEDFIYTYHHKLFPVVEEGRLRGCITTRQVKALPRAEWPQRLVATLMEPVSPENTISPDTDALRMLARMNQTDVSRFMVAEGERLLGVITLKDLLQFFALKMELEDDAGGTDNTKWN